MYDTIAQLFIGAGLGVLFLIGLIIFLSAGAARDRREIDQMFDKRKTQRGTVKWFDPIKGYGFITPDVGENSVYLHISAVERAGYTTLAAGQRVEYQLVSGHDGRVAAENLVILPQPKDDLH